MFTLQLRENEKILRMYRQADLTLAKPVLVIFAALYIPWGLLLKYDLVAQFGWWLFGWTVIVLLYGVHEYLLWLLHVTLVTNQRLIFVRYPSLLHKKVAEAPLDRITQLSIEVKGLFNNLLSYGDITVVLAGSHQTLALTTIAEPNKVHDYLWALIQKKAAVAEQPAVIKKP